MPAFGPRGPAHTVAVVPAASGTVLPASLQLDQFGALIVTGTVGSGGGGSGGNVIVTNVPLPVTGAVDVTNDPLFIFGTADVTVTGSTGLMVAAPPGAPLWVTGSFSSAGSSPGQPTYVSVTSSLPVTVQQPLEVYSSGTVGVSGSVALTNWPALVGVSGSVTVGQWGTNVTASVSAPQSAPVWVTGSVDVINAIFSASIGNISINNFPPFQLVGTEGPQGVTGSVALTNWPATLGISGSVTVGAWGTNVTASVQIAGQGSGGALNVQGVTGGTPLQVFNEGTVGVSGSVSLTNWPLTTNVSGTVTVTATSSLHVTVDNPLNIPQPLEVYSSGTVGISGSVSIANWPAVIAVSASGGGIEVLQQGTVGVSGTVGVNNFPAVQVVTGTVNVSGLVFSGTVQTIVARSTVHSCTNYAAALTSQVAAVTDTSRIGITFFNVFGSSGNCYISLGNTASTGSYTVALLPGTYWSPDTLSQESYSFIYDAVPGNLMVTIQD